MSMAKTFKKLTIQIRVDQKFLDDLDAWIAQQDFAISRSEAIRSITAKATATHGAKSKPKV
jgi:metal-responsive CopG/Arc/MetJ family transcriptional regulator